MKKLLFCYAVILLMLLSIRANSQIVFKSYAEAGYYNGNLEWTEMRAHIITDPSGAKYNGVVPVENGINDYLRNQCYTELNFSAAWKGLTASTNLLTVIKPFSVISYLPLQTQYDISLTYQYNKRLLLNVAHMCTHSTESYVFRGGHTKLGIRVYFTD